MHTGIYWRSTAREHQTAGVRGLGSGGKRSDLRLDMVCGHASAAVTRGTGVRSIAPNDVRERMEPGCVHSE